MRTKEEEMESNGAICPHLITHIDPAIESLLREKCGIELSSINQWTLETFQNFGQLGIQAQWLLDNIELIEKIYGQIIDSQVSWNKAVAALTKKGFSAIEGFDKQAVDAAISLRRRASKLLEGQDRLANADVLHSQLRSDNNEKDKIRIGVRLAQSLAELEQAKNDAMSEPAIQAAMAAWKQTLGIQAKQAKLALQYGYDASTHPKWGGEFCVGNQAQSWGNQSQFSGYQQPRQFGNSGDAINWTSYAKNFVGSIGNGLKKISRFFGGN
jgi:hypothetical protein